MLPHDEAEPHLRRAGCNCSIPLSGYRPNVGPRCRLCNVVAVIEEGAKWHMLNDHDKICEEDVKKLNNNEDDHSCTPAEDTL